MNAPSSPFEPGLGYRLSPDVALRPEPFGAMAYHFGTRKLSFLKTPDLVELVHRLGAYRSVSEALTTVDERQRPAFLRALAALAASSMIVPQADGHPGG